MSKRMTILNIFLLILLYSCGNAGQENVFIQNPDVNEANTTDLTNIDNPATGIDIFDIDPGVVCANGGINILTFIDTNSDYTYQLEESILKSKSICHGLNGLNGVNGISSITDLEAIPAGTQCPNGGVKISSGSAVPVYVCHGQNGMQGIQGIAGAAGTQVIPIKFCTNDNSAYPEYGLQVGNEVFGVFWGTSPASPSVSQAFFAKIVPGQYMSTGGNGCVFTVP